MTMERPRSEESAEKSELHTEELQSLRENQRVLETLLSNLPGMVYRSQHDANWTMEFVSEGCRELTGYASEDFLQSGRVSFGKLIAREDQQTVLEKIQAAVEVREPFELHYRIQTASGEEKHVWDRGRGIFSEAGKLLAIEGFITDVTERHKAEAARAKLEVQLRQAQKLDALGTLAGGIAHDFNNILTVIMAYTELASWSATSLDEARKYLVEIAAASDRARDLVRQILTFSRHQNQERKPIHLQPHVQEALKLLHSTLPKTVEIDAQIDSGPLVVLADPTQIHQIVMNLCLNSVHAMRGRLGRLTVNLRGCIVDEALAQTVHGLRPGSYAHLTVSDTGHGIDSETLKRIYEPFFTTKAPGEGTGLGLPVVHDIVQGHEGAIGVKSQPGAGTTFDIYLPIHRATPADLPQIAELLPRGNGENILFVDDEPSICAFAQIILEHLGYRPTTQTNPSEALLLFQRLPNHFAMVITDLSMPRVSGLELAQRISRLYPQTIVLLTTGSIDPWTMDNVREFGIRNLIAKPFSPMTLATIIHQALKESKQTSQ